MIKPLLTCSDQVARRVTVHKCVNSSQRWLKAVSKWTTEKVSASSFGNAVTEIVGRGTLGQAAGSLAMTGFQAAHKVTGGKSTEAIESREGQPLRKCIPQLLAKLSFLLSLQQSKLIDGSNMIRPSQDDIVKPARPHCIQILGILCMLNMANQEEVKSHLAQILTGQGKSWALLRPLTASQRTSRTVRTLLLIKSCC